MKNLGIMISSFFILLLIIPANIQEREERQYAYNEPLFSNSAYSTADPSDKHFALNVSESEHLFAAYFEPLVIREGMDNFSLMIGVKHADVDSIKIKNPWFLLYQGMAVEWIPLYDDGTHGDQLTGDKQFQISDLSSSAYSPLPVNTHYIRRVAVKFYYANGDTTTYNEDLGRIFHSIDASTVPIPEVTPIADDMFKTDFVVNIVLPLNGNFPNHEVSDIDIAKRYYDFLRDDRDFLIIHRPFNSANKPEAEHFVISNDVKGTGTRIFNWAVSRGSKGRLKGISRIYPPGIGSFRTLNHELLHQWAVYLDPSLDLGISHWGVIQRPSTGFGRGGSSYNGVYSSIEHIEGKIYKAVSMETDTNKNVAIYNDIELYLMGLARLSEIANPISTLIRPIFKYQNLVSPYRLEDIYEADGIRAVDVSEIVAKHGDRMPTYINSQKDFTAAFVVVYNRHLSSVELAYYDYLAREYENPFTNWSTYLNEADQITFEQATGGRSMMTTRLPEIEYAPVITSLSPPPDTVVTENDSVLFSIKAKDIDDDSLSYTWFLDGSVIAEFILPVKDGPSNLWINFPFDSKGMHSVRILISDGESKEDTSWNVTVKEIISKPDKPVIISLPKDSSKFTINFTNNAFISFNFKGGEVTNSTLLINQVASFSDRFPDVPAFEKALCYYDISLDSDNFNAELSFGYTDSLLTVLNVSEDSLVVSIFDSTDSRGYIWHVLPSEIDKNKKIVTVTTTRFSLWAVTRKDEGIITRVNDIASAIPKEFKLFKNYPNPFNPITTIEFHIPQPSRVVLRIYNLLGQEIKTIINQNLDASSYRVEWDGTDNQGVPVSSGIYLYQLRTEKFMETKKLSLIK